MKISGRIWRVGAAAALLLVAAAALSWPEMRYRSALPKYKFGITADALARETGVRIDLRKNGNYLGDDATDLEKRRHFSYDARVPRDYVELYFNDFQELVGISKRTPLARLGFSDRKLHSMFDVPTQ